MQRAEKISARGARQGTPPVPVRQDAHGGERTPIPGPGPDGEVGSATGPGTGPARLLCRSAATGRRGVERRARRRCHGDRGHRHGRPARGGARRGTRGRFRTAARGRRPRGAVVPRGEATRGQGGGQNRKPGCDSFASGHGMFLRGRRPAGPPRLGRVSRPRFHASLSDPRGSTELEPNWPNFADRHPFIPHPRNRPRNRIGRRFVLPRLGPLTQTLRPVRILPIGQSFGCTLELCGRDAGNRKRFVERPRPVREAGSRW
jgi:hypothetical protein